MEYTRKSKQIRRDEIRESARAYSVVNVDCNLGTMPKTHVLPRKQHD